jgi:hypothetical protein
MSSSDDTRISHALAEVLVGGVVGEPFKLILNSLGERRVEYDGVFCLFVGKVRIEVGNVKNRFLNVRLSLVHLKPSVTMYTPR